MAGDPQMRASDADRDHATALLREHHAAGRLTAEEFQERMDLALEARTIGQLDALMTDLPAIDLHHLPGESVARSRPVPRDWPAAAGGPGGHVARRAGPGAPGVVVVAGVIIAAYLVLGLAAGIWWIPWWLLVFIPLVLRRRRH